MASLLDQLINEIAIITGSTVEEVRDNYTKDQLDHLLQVSKCDEESSVAPIAVDIDVLSCKDDGSPSDLVKTLKETGNFPEGLKDAQNSSIDSNYNKILNISEYINISVAELSSTVRDLKYKFNDLIEIFEPSISGIPISEKKPFDSNNIINLKYTKFLNWERRSEWLAEEENDYQDFNENILCVI